MIAPACNNSQLLTSYSQVSSRCSRCSSCDLNNPYSFEFSQFSLKKSIFDPSLGLAQTFQRRKKLSTFNNPQVQIIHSCPKWLLLQAPLFKTNFFQVLKKGKLGNLEQQLLKLFKSFVSLSKFYGFFRPTQKMIFMNRKQFKVWINEDIFSNTPLMPIHQGKESQKQFVIAFLAMLSACLEGWEKISNITTIKQTLMVLQQRCKPITEKFSSIKSIKCTNFKPEGSQVSFDQKSSQYSFSQQINKLNLNSTSSSLIRFSEIFSRRTSMGETKLQVSILDVENQLEIPQIHLQFENLFVDEDLGGLSEQASLERLVKQFKETLNW